MLSLNPLRILTHPVLAKTSLREPCLAMLRLHKNPTVDAHVTKTRTAVRQHDVDPSIALVSRVVAVTKQDFEQLTQYDQAWTLFRGNLQTLTPEEQFQFKILYAQQLADFGHLQASKFLNSLTDI